MSIDTDIITGFPKDPSEEDLTKIRKRSQDLRVEVDLGRQTIRAMSSKSGRIFRDHCESILFGRINAFVKSDPACQAILQVLDSIGVQIDSAKVAAQKLSKEQLREEGQD
jgi:hypothetical protein